MINKHLTTNNNDNNKILIIMDILTKYIKQTENELIDKNDLIIIINYLNDINISTNNLHLILKLISNIIFYSDIISDINLKIKIDLNNLIATFDDILTDGHIISLVKIYCSVVYSNPTIAIELINKYTVHKTSSYIPIFEYLIKFSDYQLIKKLYALFNNANKQIIKSNRLIKESNYKTRLYNENIKLLKLKYTEINTIINALKDIQLVDNPYINHKLYTYPIIELKHQTEQNLIIINHTINYGLLEIAIQYSDDELILSILKNINIIDLNILPIITKYYVKHQYTILKSTNICSCCNQTLKLEIISDNVRQDIIDLLTEKILDINHRTDNGLIINHKEILNIKHRFIELNNLLINYDFNIVIDGGNVGFYNMVNSGELNINYLNKIINKIIKKTDKYILLIIHQRHQSKIKQLNNNQYLKILLTPFNLDDDLFWLYATLYSKAFIFTNDMARDNSCMIGYQTEIKQYLAYYQIKQNIDIDFLTINKYNLVENQIISVDDRIHIKLDSNKLICI